MVGILLALQVNNWNQKRLAHQVEAKFLLELKTDLINNLSEINTDLQNNLIGLNASFIVRNFIMSNSAYHDSLGIYFQTLSIDAQLYPNSGTYESIKSTGIDIITSDSLRNRLSQYYEVSLKDIVELGRVEQAQLSHIYQMGPFLQKHFRIDTNIVLTNFRGWVPPEGHKVYGVKPLSIEAIRNDHPYLIEIQNAMSKRGILIDRLKKAMEETQEIIDMIDSKME